MKTIAGIVILAVCVGGVYLLNDLTRTEDGRSRLHVAGELVLDVETAPPQTRAIIRTVQAPGEVEAFEEVDISSEVMGKIVELLVDEGDLVEQGQLLCRLDDADYRARVLSAEAEVARLGAAITQAHAEVEEAELDYAEQLRLIEIGATSVDTVRQFALALKSAQALLAMREQELVAAKAFRESAREELEKTVIRTPLSGVVSQLFAESGEVVITGTMNNPGTRILVISDLSKMQVRCRVDEADAALVKMDQPARIYLQSDSRRSVAGTVLRMGTKGTKPLGRDVVTFETLVLITGQDERVKPGMSANVEIEVARREDALTIPLEAVVYRKRRDVPEELVAQHDARLAELNEGDRQNRAEYLKLVFCIDDDKALPRLIETGINDVTGVEIVEGIGADDTIVIGPYRSLDKLKAGSPVRLAEKPKPSGPEKAADEAAEAPAEAVAAEDGATSQPAKDTVEEDAAAEKEAVATEEDEGKLAAGEG